jgi:uncharacterized protein with von Willebrand factor type A (vWA) domain
VILEGLLYNLRAQGVGVGTGEWLAFMEGLERGLAADVNSIYWLGRAVLVHDEKHYDAWDVAFKATFEGVELPPDFSRALAEWLAEAREGRGGTPPPGFSSLEEMRKELERRLKEQKERHDGGRYWIGTGGVSPFGHSGANPEGIRVGGPGGRRSAVQVASERQWGTYRTDVQLDVRDFKVALGMLRKLAREGREELDVDATIRATGENAGEIELRWRKERANRVHLLLLMDVGGSMDPYAQLVSRLFTAAKELKIFKSFEALYFHNCPYGFLYKDFRTAERRPTGEVLAGLTPHHRVLWVGDASMAPWELFSTGYGVGGRAGIDWIRAFAQRCPASAWLNPDPPGAWNHPTVRAIGQAVPMHPLTLEGLKGAVKALRSGA